MDWMAQRIVVVDFWRMDGSFFSMAVLVGLLGLGGAVVVVLLAEADISDVVDLEDASDDTIVSSLPSFAAVFVEFDLWEAFFSSASSSYNTAVVAFDSDGPPADFVPALVEKNLRS